MKKHKILILVIIILQFIFLSINTYVNADIEDPVKNPDYYKPGVEHRESYNGMLTAAGTVLEAIRNIGIIVSVLAVMVVGVKYIIGSVEEKAEYKSTLIPIVIGIIMISSIITIIDIIYTITNNIFK